MCVDLSGDEIVVSGAGWGQNEVTGCELWSFWWRSWLSTVLQPGHTKKKKVLLSIAVLKHSENREAEKDYNMDLDTARALDETFSPLRDISHTIRMCGCDYAWLLHYNILTHTHTNTHNYGKGYVEGIFKLHKDALYRVLLETRTQLERSDECSTVVDEEMLMSAKLRVVELCKSSML